MTLHDLDCRHAKPKEKAYRVTDTEGLYLDIMPTGKKIWRLRYYFFGKEKLLTIGPYPSISLSEARKKREQAKDSLRDGIDPSQQKQDQKKLARFKQEQTFERVATEWHKYHYDTWTPPHAMHLLSRLKQNVFPFIGSTPIAEVTAQHLLACLRRIEERGSPHMARRVLQIMGQVMRYAVITERAERDITVDLKGALKRYKKGHYAAISSDQLPDLIKAINQNDARLFKQTILAIKLLMLTFVRTGELINATWDEFDLKNAVWTIPAERMKMRVAHVVPLSKQVMAILNELRSLYGTTGYILPSVVRSNKPISNVTVLKALERLGYKGQMTGHGFRALAMSTIKEHLGYRHEVVDRQLAHQPRNKIDAAYDRAQFLPDRKKMMQEWSDYIDKMADKEK